MRNKILFIFTLLVTALFGQVTPGGGIQPINKGGTGKTTAAAAFDNLSATTETAVASAATTDLGTVAAQKVSITGVVTITSFGTVAAGVWREGRFTGALTLTHNATSLILPGAANITTAAGDRFSAYSLGSGNWVVTNYVKATGGATMVAIGTVAPAALDGGTWLQMNGQVVSQSTYSTLFAIIGHQPEFSWVYGQQMPSSATTHIAYGNSTYVAVGATGAICTSSDLVTWTSQTSGVATALNAVCWDSDNSLFVAVGASNVIITSPTGVTWTGRTSGVTSTLVNVLHANGRTVTVGSAGWISYSTNDTSWTATQPNATPSHAYLIYANSTWFTTPANTTSGIVYSTDGATWNYVAKPTTNGSNFAGFDGTYFYLIDGSGAGSSNQQVYRSTTGASWALVTPTVFEYIATTTTPGSVTFSGGVNTLLCTASGQQFGYTSDGYANFHRAIVQIPTSLPASILFNPMGNSSQHFAIVYSSTTAAFASVDGKKWFMLAAGPVLGVANIGGGTRSYFVNGHYAFPMSNTGTGQWINAAEPYNPTTQFQIPTRTDASGTALYIKAL